VAGAGAGLVLGLGLWLWLWLGLHSIDITLHTAPQGTAPTQSLQRKQRMGQRNARCAAKDGTEYHSKELTLSRTDSRCELYTPPAATQPERLRSEDRSSGGRV